MTPKTDTFENALVRIAENISLRFLRDENGDLKNAFKVSFFTHPPRCPVPNIWTPEIGLKMTEMFNHFVFQNKYFLTLKILATY